MDLQSKLKTIIAEQNIVLKERQYKKENVIKPYQTHIEQAVKSTDEWNTFLAILTSAFEERETASEIYQKYTNCD